MQPPNADDACRSAHPLALPPLAARKIVPGQTPPAQQVEMEPVQRQPVATGGEIQPRVEDGLMEARAVVDG
jgi:hypothetical protein